MSEQTAPKGEERQWTIFSCRRCGLLDPADCGRDFDCGYSTGVEIEVVPLERALRAEEAARNFAVVLDDLANLHHCTLVGSKLHNPDVTDYTDCECRTCSRAAQALARHPGFLPQDDGLTPVPSANENAE